MHVSCFCASGRLCVCALDVHSPTPARHRPATRTARTGLPAQHKNAINDHKVRMCMCMYIACMLAPGQIEPARGMLTSSLPRKHSARDLHQPKRTRQEPIPNP